MKKNKAIKIISMVFLLIVLGFIFNPFYWLMKPLERSLQPELSTDETTFFSKIKNIYNCNIERSFYNYDLKGKDTLYEEYNKFPFRYSLSIDLKEDVTNIEKDSIYKMGIYIKDVILKKNQNLKRIIIYENFKKFDFFYNSKKDSLVIDE